MSRTRSQFKFALRYCKQHEDSVRSDLFASSLAVKDYRKFWNDIRKTNNKQSTLYVDCVNGCNGESDITDMWQRHYQQLYNSISDSEARETLLKRILDIGCGSGNVVITIHDVVEACSKQKSGKAVGLDGIAMEAFMHGGPRMHVHLCMLFNMFIRYGYIPSSFMKSVIIPLVKCKTGNLADVNNYRAIAISTAASKLLENVLSGYIRNDDHSDAYQFGFTSGCSTSLCTNVFKRTVDCYTHGGSHVFVSFLDFSRAFDKVSYWKLFHKLLDDNINVAFVKLLIFWYSKQEMCVRWHDSVSRTFTVGNGTRQGGVLSPWFFARYTLTKKHHGNPMVSHGAPWYPMASPWILVENQVSRGTPWDPMH
jgi:SAM-dependent methyltransferase